MTGMRTLVMSAVLGTALVSSATVAIARDHATGPKSQTAAADKWVMLAERTADRLTDHDTIVLDPPQNYRSVKFAAKDSRVHVKHINVTFANGVVERIEVNQEINEGEQGQPIKLPSVGQKVTKIEMLYDTSGVFKARGKVMVFAMK